MSGAPRLGAVSGALGMVPLALGAVSRALGAVPRALGAVSPALGAVSPALGAVLLALAAFLALPASASAHAYLVKTVPAASQELTGSPAQIQLTYDEAVEPRFAIISVTDAQGHQETSGPVRRSAANPDTLIAPLRPHLPEGWYLIYWRAISVDGHPVSGAFTYAVGPSAGPAPQFQVPDVSATTVTPQLLITRWLMFAAVMVSIGLFALRLVIARRLATRLPGASLRPLSVALVASSILGLVAIPVYLDLSTANDSLRSVFDVGGLVPLFGVTAFGRAILRLELCFGLFCAATCIGLWVERPANPRRTVAELAATTGAVLAAAAVLVVPGTSGHAAQTPPRGLSLLFNWAHMAAGSIWLGGLVGLLVLWLSTTAALRTTALSVAVPRFSKVALASVGLLAASGIGEAIDHLPAIDALWLTGYGRAILVKTGLFAAALLLASGNLLRTRPALAAATREPEAATRAAIRLGGLVSGELLLVTGAVFTAALLSSLAPPPPAFALQNQALARVGPGTVVRSIDRAGYRLQLLVAPNRAAAPDRFELRITRNGHPVRSANVTLAFDMTTMQMPQQEYQLTETRPGVYSRAVPALVMVGEWGLTFQISPKGSPPFSALILDQANG